MSTPLFSAIHWSNKRRPQTPLFLTEVMEISLRALLQERFLSQTEIPVIALDVARRLNYLHQKHPIPILHRDISSVNVLLWRQGTQWRTEVSDYGTANFKKQTMKVAPGALIYSAPEARATNQTVQVLSVWFVVLLLYRTITYKILQRKLYLSRCNLSVRMYLLKTL